MDNDLDSDLSARLLVLRGRESDRFWHHLQASLCDRAFYLRYQLEADVYPEDSAHYRLRIELNTIQSLLNGNFFNSEFSRLEGLIAARKQALEDAKRKNAEREGDGPEHEKYE